MMSDQVIQAATVSDAWARAFIAVNKSKHREVTPLVVTASAAFGIVERPAVRAHLDAALAEFGETAVDTVAGTIFPESLWNRSAPRQAVFDRYTRIWPRIRKVRANANGTYFRRFTAFGAGEVNQIEHVLSTYDKGNHRRSALQLAVFDPATDHVHNRQRGFPCLHQVALVPDSDGRLSLTAFYATQTMFEKAYGNYLGLARLGTFLASELGMPFAGLTCVSSVAVATQNKAFEKKRADFCRRLEAIVEAS